MRRCRRRPTWPAPAHCCRAVTRCPGCGSSHTTWVDAAAQDNFLCKTRGTCWHPGHGRIDRVDPQQCPGGSLGRICSLIQPAEQAPGRG